MTDPGVLEEAAQIARERRAKAMTDPLIEAMAVAIAADRGEWFERHAEPLLSHAEALEAEIERLQSDVTRQMDIANEQLRANEALGAQLVIAREALWNAAEVLVHQEEQEGDAEISARFAEQQCRNALAQIGE
jgi:hypothetical protein